MMEVDSRRIRRSNNTDRISGLPNCISGIILSFLTTKEAVSTSLLSKRWTSAWFDVHNLDLSSRDFVKSRDDAENMVFIRFVHRAFLLVDCRPLYKFSLDWHTYVDSSHMICWIDAAIIRNVHEITLYLGEGDLFRFPISGFNCHSLRSLQIDSIFFVYDTTMVSLPRLETLILTYVRFTSEEAFEKLINGCPMLHYLKLEVYSSFNDDDDDDDDDVDGEEDFVYLLSSPSLRHLDMYIEDRCTLKLNASSLEYLRLNGHISKIIGGKCLTSLIKADFDTGFDKHDDDFPHNLIVEAVRALEHAKSLTLSSRVLQALSRATISLSTEFKRLVKLVVRKYSCSVQDFIHNSENLEDLMICQGYRRIDTSNPAAHHSRWAARVVVPRCLSKSLKNVRYDGYKGLEDEREMIRYMLEHGSVLEDMHICCSSDLEDGEKLELVHEICEFPRMSPVCKVSTWPTKRKLQELYYSSNSR